MDQNGGSNRRKAFAERSLGYALRAAGDFRAADAFSKAADSFAKLYGADGVEVGMTRTILAECLRQELRMTEAERRLHSVSTFSRRTGATSFCPKQPGNAGFA